MSEIWELPNGMALRMCWHFIAWFDDKTANWFCETVLHNPQEKACTTPRNERPPV